MIPSFDTGNDAWISRQSWRGRAAIVGVADAYSVMVDDPVRLAWQPLSDGRHLAVIEKRTG